MATSSSASHSFNNTMTMDQAEVLHDYQVKFEGNPSVDNAYKLFRELNKHHMYLTVIKLYYKNEMDAQKKTETNYSMMQSQFEYARDHIQQGHKTGFEQEGSYGSGQINGQWPVAYTRAWYMKILDFFISIGVPAVFIYYLYKEY